MISAATAVPDADIVLRDGSTIHVRPSTSGDEPRLRAFLSSLSEESRWFRFFSAGVNLAGAAHEAAAPAQGLSLLAVRGADDAVVGHGTYVGGPGRAEVAFAVADAWHGHGIATVLLAHLAQAASREDIATFTATVMRSNHRMLRVFHDSGFPVSVSRVDDVIELEFPTSLSPDARRRFEDHQRAANVAAVAHVLRPASVAVIGASRRPRTLGGEVVRNLLAGGFSGPLHLVNLRAGEVAGRPTVRSIADVEGDVELAVIAVPTAAVLETAGECAEKGVRALVVLTAGFAEVGPEGRARQDELLAVCRAAGMRMVGPNCLGVANLHHRTTLNATFAPGELSPGNVAFATQSAAFGIAAIDEAAARGIGLSSFVSMGDKADLSGNDFLEYWEQDPETAVLALYLTSFGNPRRFGRVVRRITKDKPVVAVKSGRTAAGERAASSRTGALLAASDVTVDALFAHAGVLRAETVGEMFDVAGLLARQPLPRGDRVAVLTNAGGPGTLCADACEAAGLRIEPPSAATRARLAEGLAPEASTGNPVNMIASATADQYERSLRILLADDCGRCRRDDLRPPARGARGRGRPRDRRRRRGRRPAGARRLARRRHSRGRGHRRGAVLHHARVCGAGAGARGPARAPPRRAAGPPVRGRRRRHRDRGDDRRREAWAGCRPATSSDCWAAGASRWWRAGSSPRRRPRAGPPRSSGAPSRSRASCPAWWTGAMPAPFGSGSRGRPPSREPPARWRRSCRRREHRSRASRSSRCSRRGPS